jgi:hypothetical protein
MGEALKLSPEELAVMGAEGRARVIKHHSAAREAAHLAELAEAAKEERRS